MTTRARLQAALRLTPEVVLCLCVLASLVAVAVSFSLHGYLPQPFIYDTNDTYMDWYNTSYWANNPGAYSVWRSVYPPLSFVFLKAFSLPGCYLSSPFFARDCDWLGQVVIYAFYLLDVVLVFVALDRIHRPTAPARALAFAFGLPLLYAVERGNLIVPCLAFFVIAHGDLAKSRLWRWLSIALTINFKPYLLLPVLPVAIKRRWRDLEGAGIATLALYLLTFAVVGAGSPQDLISNTANWAQFQSGQLWNEIYYSTSYAALLQVQAAHYPVLSILPSRTVELIYAIVPIIIRASQGLTLTCLIGAWLQPKALPLHRLSTLLTAMSLVTRSPGGYAQVFLLFMVFMEPWRRPGQIVAIIVAYMLCLSVDRNIASVMEVNGVSWLGHRSVVAGFSLTVGQLARPGLIVLILWSLGIDSLLQIVRAHRREAPRLGLAPYDAAPAPAGA